MGSKLFKQFHFCKFFLLWKLILRKLQVYINPLQKLGYLVNSKEFTLIVSTLTMIINVNSVLLKNLETNSLSTQFGKLFQTFAPFLKIYTQYTNGYDSAINIVRTLRQNDKKAHETILKMEKQSIANGGLDFKSYLILPVQRIPVLWIVFFEENCIA